MRLFCQRPRPAGMTEKSASLSEKSAQPMREQGAPADRLRARAPPGTAENKLHPVPPNGDLLDLGQAMWAWRAETQPLSGDDIPRIERPAGWVPDWSADAVTDRRRRLQEF